MSDRYLARQGKVQHLSEAEPLNAALFLIQHNAQLITRHSLQADNAQLHGDLFACLVLLAIISLT